MASLSVEEENFVRMCLLLTGISPRAARTFFDNKFAPASLDATIKKEYNKLFDLKKSRRINQSQWNLLFPRSLDVPDSKTFDVTLMTTLLMNLTRMTPPLCGFDRLPSAMETTQAADLARIKHYKNYLAHLEDNKIDTSVYNTAWTDITGAIGRLGGQQMTQECDHLKTKPLDLTNQRTKDEIKGLTQPLRSLKHLQARNEVMLKTWKDNDDKMFVKTRAAEHVLKCIKQNSCVTITASSGVGKTATLQHVALQMVEEGYDVLVVTEPCDIVKFYNPTQKTLFVIDDLCGNFAVNLSDMKSWEQIMDIIKNILENEQTKIIAACRLQVYQDYKFESLSVFNSCVCNLLSENIRLSKAEKQSIAKLYLKTKSSEIADFHDLYDSFPLLCKLYHDNPIHDITNFFKNPFSVYEAEIDRLLKNGYYMKYCALALCVMFNNKLKEEILTEEVNEETRTIIDNTCEACRLSRGTHRLSLHDELNSLKDTFIIKEHGVYKAIHNKIFDFLAFYFGQKIISCLIRHADSGLIKNRFLLERNDDMDQFITVIPPQNHHMYIQRMIDDWSKGKVQDVFSNTNMKKPLFTQKFLSYLNALDISHQRRLAHTCDVYYKDTALLQCCFIGDIPLIRWCISQNVDINQSRLDGLTPLFAAKGHTEVVRLLLENKAAIFKCRDNWSKDERIPEEIRNMEQQSIDIYKRALKSGSEKKRDINLVIVGKKGAGKTSLVRRLFGEEFTNLESTNGIEIHRRQCKIKSNEWTRIGDKDKESDLNIRIQKSFVNQLCMKDKNERKSETLLGMSERQNVGDLVKEDIIYANIDDEDAINGRTKNSTRETDSTGKVLAVESDQPTMFESYTNPKSSDQTASKELSTIFKSDVVLKDDEDYTLTLWDFAGDEEFYATHQTFLNPDAVYLVVANLNDKDNANHEHVTFKFWMETIHCYGCRADTQEVGPNTQDTPLNPPVIFVGTHTDELQNQDECSMQITSHMDKLCKDTRLHLRTCHQISNKSDGNDKFQKIREDIFALATNSKTAEKEYPVKFIQLERVLHAEYTSEKHVRILSFNRVKELASKISIPITEEDELNLFLRYQNEIGNLLYFNDIPEYIILDPQWLADAFKCIVTATKFQEKLPCFIEWKEVKETGKIKLNLMQAIFNLQQAYIKDHQSHLIAVMEKFDIIINPVVQTNRDPTDKDVFFYIPCMMQVNKIEEVDKLFEVEDEYKSMCLCFIFNFLPPYLISHLIVSCLRKYTVAFAQQQEGLFKDCCVFDVSECGCTKLLLVKCGSMIELQIWQWDKEIPCQYEEIFCFIKGEIDSIINTRNRMTTVSFEIKWKCSLTSYTCEYGFKDFGKVEDGKEFHCGEHKRKHKYKDDWFGDTSKKSGGKLPAGLREIDEEAGPAKKKRKVVSRVARPTLADRSRGVNSSSVTKKSGGKLPAGLREIDEKGGPAKKKHKVVSGVVRPTLADRSRGVNSSSVTKLKLIFQEGMSVVSNISEESSRAGSLTGFSKEEINFTKMGMIVLNVLVSVLYDLLKKDTTNVRPRSESDITYLYDLLRKLNKNVPSYSSNRQWGPWGGKWQDIQKTDLAIGDDIERIRLTRNEILHSSEFILEDKRYNELCGIIVDILKRFDQHNQPSPELYTDQMNKILAKTISDEEVKDLKHQIQNKYRAEMGIEIELEHQVNVQQH